jgi:hypothetical protein
LGHLDLSQVQQRGPSKYLVTKGVFTLPTGYDNLIFLYLILGAIIIKALWSVAGGRILIGTIIGTYGLNMLTAGVHYIPSYNVLQDGIRPMLNVLDQYSYFVISAPTEVWLGALIGLVGVLLVFWGMVSGRKNDDWGDE